jgi:hypothetical protein
LLSSSSEKAAVSSPSAAEEIPESSSEEEYIKQIRKLKKKITEANQLKKKHDNEGYKLDENQLIKISKVHEFNKEIAELEQALLKLKTNEQK